MNFDIPDGLGDMLRDFTVAVICEKPEDIHEFAADWFCRVRDKKRTRSIPMYIIVDDEEEAGEPDPSTLRPKFQKGMSRAERRQSVSAERYNPEEDEGEEEATVVYPKSDAQRQRLMEAVREILIFRCLDGEQMQKVVDAMFEHQVEPGETVIQQGEDGDNFYVIDTGTFDIYAMQNGEEKCVHSLNNSGSFGELALMYNMPRSATVKATSRGTLWAMDRQSFRTIVLKSAFKKRKMYEELLEQVPMLKPLADYERMNLADALTGRAYKDGECIIREGDEADGMYFIEQGVVRVTIQKDGREAEVSRPGKGSYFGEMALVNNKPRSANVFAVGDVRVAFLELSSFERLLGPCLDIMKRAMATYKSK